jgi:threonine dehydrogenase-like Zn-dependent dehydrogenase
MATPGVVLSDREGMDMLGKAAIFNTPRGRFEIRDVALPPIEPDGLLVQISRANICGSDLHIWRGDTPLRHGDHIIGHEMVGRVAELGSNIQTDSQGQPLAVDDRVTYLYFYFCGRCYACLEGYRSACVNMMRHPYQMGEVMISMGAYAEYYYLRPGHYVFKVPDELSDEMAAPVNCALAQVTYGLQRIGLRLGQSIVIQGAGGLGLYATAVARDMGAAKIIVIDRFEPRLQMAAAFGADHLINLGTYDTEEARVQRVRELTKGWGVDICVEVVGSPSVIPEGIRMLKNGGQYLIMGSINPKQTVPLEAGRIVFGRITLVALATYEPWVIPQALDFMRRNLTRYPFQKLISHSFPLTEINEAFQQADAGAVIRASIVP